MQLLDDRHQLCCRPDTQPSLHTQVLGEHYGDSEGNDTRHIYCLAISDFAIDDKSRSQ